MLKTNPLSRPSTQYIEEKLISIKNEILKSTNEIKEIPDNSSLNSMIPKAFEKIEEP